MLRVGLTGGIASGKTAVSDALAARGAVIIDADLLAREVVEPGTPGLAAVVERFGAEVLTGDGVLDRAALGTVVFADPTARRDLEAIIHPAVRARAAAIEAAADPDAVVVHVIPLLVETGQQADFDLLVVVDVAPEVQRERLQRRNGLDTDAAEARIAAQASRADRLSVADFVLDNSATPADLIDQVDSLWPDLRARATAG
ncbi:dephospho-CoA kinase [Microlunatus aurantiacus]|uniref:Dephospho-CoA kinase n=1 Tax=Microlunatus aurantiacus TaxID=446786 RepID=A0ABP7DQD0_9ACTN